MCILVPVPLLLPLQVLRVHPAPVSIHSLLHDISRDLTVLNLMPYLLFSHIQLMFKLPLRSLRTLSVQIVIRTLHYAIIESLALLDMIEGVR